MKNKTNQGYALFVMLIYLSVITIMASALLHLLHVHMSAYKDSERKQVCMALAEGGIEKALVSLRADPEKYVGEKDTPLGDGRFTVTVKPDKAHGSYSIISTAELVADNFVLERTAAEVKVTFDERGGIRSLIWREVRKYEMR